VQIANLTAFQIAEADTGAAASAYKEIHGGSDE
jgi:hypothetical protein